MKRTVTVTVVVDTQEYHKAKDTASGAVDLVVDMLRGHADLPRDVKVSCEQTTRTIRGES